MKITIKIHQLKSVTEIVRQKKILFKDLIFVLSFI